MREITSASEWAADTTLAQCPDDGLTREVHVRRYFVEMVQLNALETAADMVLDLSKKMATPMQIATAIRRLVKLGEPPPPEEPKELNPWSIGE